MQSFKLNLLKTRFVLFAFNSVDSYTNSFHYFPQKNKAIIGTCTSQLITKYTTYINFILTFAKTKAQNISESCPEVLLTFVELCYLYSVAHGSRRLIEGSYIYSTETPKISLYALKKESTRLH